MKQKNVKKKGYNFFLIFYINLPKNKEAFNKNHKIAIK